MCNGTDAGELLLGKLLPHIQKAFKFHLQASSRDADA